MKTLKLFLGIRNEKLYCTAQFLRDSVILGDTVIADLDVRVFCLEISSTILYVT